MTGASVTAMPVKFAPLIAGRVPVKFAAGKLVRDAPEPENVVAASVPVTVAPVVCVYNLTTPFVSLNWHPVENWKLAMVALLDVLLTYKPVAETAIS